MRLAATILILAGLLAPACDTAAAAASRPSVQVRKNIQHSLRTARLAERRGDFPTALEAYQSIATLDPTNKEAEAGIARVAALLRPNTTKYTLEVGGGVESNPARQTPGSKPAWLGIARFDVKDERSFGGVQWRSIGQLLGDFYTSQNTFNYAYAGGTTGPVFYINPDLRVHVAVGAGTSMFSNVWFYNEAVSSVAVESAYWNGVQSIRLRAGYRDYNSNDFAATSGYYVDLVGRFGFFDQLKKGDTLIFSPWYRHSAIGGVGFLVTFDAVQPGTYEEVGARAEYFYPVTDWMVLGGNYATTWREYAAVANLLTGISTQRTDVIYSPGASVIFPSLIRKDVDLRVDYRADFNRSNSAIDTFDDHIVTSSVVARF